MEQKNQTGGTGTAAAPAQANHVGDPAYVALSGADLDDVIKGLSKDDLVGLLRTNGIGVFRHSPSGDIALGWGAAQV
ncbi:MAG TPA: hypothetical protein VF525_08080 [Pyrinomonadaceae bacterium]|jgi:hypothetical protein